MLDPRHERDETLLSLGKAVLGLSRRPSLRMLYIVRKPERPLPHVNGIRDVHLARLQLEGIDRARQVLQHGRPCHSLLRRSHIRPDDRLLTLVPWCAQSEPVGVRLVAWTLARIHSPFHFQGQDHGECACLASGTGDAFLKDGDQMWNSDVLRVLTLDSELCSGSG